jgi:hypothetical protein
MKTRITCLLVAMAMMNAAYSQKIKGVTGFLKLGYTMAPGSADTFDKIAPEGVTGYTNHFIALGADGYYRTGNIILGLDGLVGIQGERSKGSWDTEPFVGSGHAKFGWILQEGEQFWLYPSFGAGTSFMILNAHNKVGELKTMQDRVLFSPSFDLGFNGDFIVTSPPGDRNKYGALLLGMRIGYRASFRNNNWVDQDGDEFEYNPYYSNNAFYVTITIGGGWFIKK